MRVLIGLLCLWGTLMSYEMKKIQSGEYEATLIYSPLANNDKSIFYLHGFNDYVFNEELIGKINQAGYGFFGIELHNYGRNITENTQYPYYFDDVRDFFPELLQAVEYVKNTYSIQELTILAHSQGGLIASLLADKYPDVANRLVLNSPFFDFYLPFSTQIFVPFLSFLGEYNPHLNTNTTTVASKFGQSISNKYMGEWEVDERYKHIDPAPPIYLGWLRAIHLAQQELQSGLDIKMPVLVMHSDKSAYEVELDMKNSQDLHSLRTTDVVLDVEDIKEYSAVIGEKVTTLEIKEAIHDVFLSQKSVRDRAFVQMMEWVEEN